MRASVLLFATLLASTAAAEVPISLGVGAGVVTSVGPWRGAPSLAFDGGVGLPGGHFAVTGRVDGWTLGTLGPAVANSEVTASVGGAYSQEIISSLYWSAGAAAAMTFLSRAGSSLETRPGVLLTPGLELATRRRTLALQVGGTALLSTAGVRLGATAGVVYTFR
jgi:hypothetical protein